MSRLEKRGPSALEAWARQKTDGYNGVTIRNMTTSWRNGLAFCALIHRYRPDLIDYEKLDPRDILGNCALAFEVAERQLGIPALLDPEDMVNHEVPDRLSILTYVAQFYNTFKSLEKKSNVTTRLSISPDENVLKARPLDNSSPTSPENVKAPVKRTLDLEDEIMNETRKRVPTRAVMLNSANACSECKNPVFLSERILFAKKLYHRSCFRCFNCKRILNPHTAEVSPDGLLFCLENACHIELRKRSESSVNVSINNGSRTTGVNNNEQTMSVDGDKTPRSENIVPTADLSNETSSPTAPRKTSIQAKFPPFNAEAPKKENPVITNFTVKDRVAALRNKFLSECHAGDDELSRSRPLSLREKRESRERVRGKSRSRSRSRSRSPAQISVGMAREPSDVLVNASYSDYVKIEPMDEVECEDEGISSLGDRGEDSNVNKLEINEKVEIQIPEVTSKAVHTPGMLSVAEQLAANAKVMSNMQEEKNIGADFLRKINNSSSSSPRRVRLIEGVDATKLLETKKVPPTPPPKIPIATKSEIQNTPTPPSSPKTQKSVLPEITEKVPEVPIILTNTGDTQIVLGAKQEIEADQGHSTEDEYFEAPLIKESELEAEVVQTVNPSPEVSNLVGEDPVTHIIAFPTPDIKNLPNQTPEKSKVDDSTSTSTSVLTPSPSPRKREKAPPPPRPAPPKQMQKATVKESTKEVWKKKNYYPAELNPFESEEQFVEPPKNPFENEDDEKEETISTPVKASPTPTPRARSSNRSTSKDVNSLRSRSRSPVLELVSHAPPSPKPRTTISSSTPVIESRPLNPFEDEEEEGDESGVSVRAGDETSSTCSRLSDGSSFNSSIGGNAHPTPKPRDRDSTISHATETNSMKLKSRKNKRAPLPPSFMGQVTPEPKPLEPPKSPKSILKHTQTTMNGSANLDDDGGERSGASSPSPKKLIPASPKLLKGLKNHANLAVSQQYKKKRRAPPPRRRVEPLPEAAIKTELEDLGIQERELERQGITLESNIRRLMDDDPDNDQVDDMMVQLWSIVDEKNDILRRQTELEFLRRGHHLEEMQADLEFQLRILMDTPTNQRQDDHTHVEDALLEEMLKIVDERNEVVEWLDFHRKQDHEGSQSLTSFTSSNRNSDANGATPPEEEIVVTSLPRTKSKKSKSKDKQSKDRKDSKDKDKEKNKDDRKMKFGTLFGRKKNKMKKDKLDDDKDLGEGLSTGNK